MAKADALRVTVELRNADYMELLKHAPKRSRVLGRLLVAVEHKRNASHIFTGFVTDGLALKAVAIECAPKAVPAIQRALKRAGGA